MKSFAENQGAELIEIIDRTNFRGVKQYYEETTYLERVFYSYAVKENMEKKAENLNQSKF